MPFRTQSTSALGHKETDDAVFFSWSFNASSDRPMRSRRKSPIARSPPRSIPVSGQFDLMAKFYIQDDVDIGRFIADQVHTIPGIERDAHDPDLQGVLRRRGRSGEKFRSLHCHQCLKGNGTIGWARTTDLRIHNPAL